LGPDTLFPVSAILGGARKATEGQMICDILSATIQSFSRRCVLTTLASRLDSETLKGALYFHASRRLDALGYRNGVVVRKVLTTLPDWAIDSLDWLIFLCVGDARDVRREGNVAYEAVGSDAMAEIA
jgi:hypothetical protein